MVVAKTLAGVLESGVGRGKTVDGLFRGKISFKAPQSTSKTFIILCVCVMCTYMGCVMHASHSGGQRKTLWSPAQVIRLLRQGLDPPSRLSSPCFVKFETAEIVSALLCTPWLFNVLESQPATSICSFDLRAFPRAESQAGYIHCKM